MIDDGMDSDDEITVSEIQDLMNCSLQLENDTKNEALQRRLTTEEILGKITLILMNLDEMMNYIYVFTTYDYRQTP